MGMVIDYLILKQEAYRFILSRLIQRGFRIVDKF